MAELRRVRDERRESRRRILEWAQTQGLDLDGLVAVAVVDPAAAAIKVHQAIEALYGLRRARQDEVLAHARIDLRRTLGWLGGDQGRGALERLRGLLHPPPPPTRPERSPRWPWA